MGLFEVLAVLEELQRSGCSVWVAGGWAVDVLVGRQTRPHQDLDLAIDSRHLTTALAVLERRGFRVGTDQLPARIEVVAVDRGRVDLHPVSFDDAGHGRQADLTGGWFDYPAGCFADGRIGGALVPCLSRDQQLRFRVGYEPRDVDRHDIALLRTCIPIPAPTVDEIDPASPLR